MKILVTGATGNVGRELVKALTQRGTSFRVMARDPKRVPDLDAVAGDFDDPASLARALEGVERAFLVTPSTERAEAQQLAFVAAARTAGVRHVVKLSQWAAAAGSPVRFLRYHAAVEAALGASGLDWTFLRPNLFMQGLLGFAETIQKKGAFFAAAGDAAISTVDVRDIADVAAAALVEEGHAGKTYDLTGPEALTHAAMAAELSTALDRTIRFVDIPEDAMRAALGELHMPPWQADGLIEDYAHYRRGEAAVVRPLPTGKARSFAAFARDYAPALHGR